MPTAAPPRIGTRLRRARVAAGLSIQEAAWRMRTRPAVLKALEREDFDDIGHTADARTHLMSYARLLGVDVAEVTEAFDLLVAGEPAPIDELDAKVGRSRKPPRARWALAATASGLVIAIAGLAGMLGGQAERPAPDVDAAPAIPAAGEVPAAEALVRLSLDVSEPVHVAIQADGVEVFKGELRAARAFKARGVMEVLAADGGAVRVTLNGRALGSLGKRGAVARARFGPDGRLAS